MFIMSGLFAIGNAPQASYFYLTASIMFGATFDNPRLFENTQDKYLRWIYLVCHAIIFACLYSFTKDIEDAEEKEEKVDSENELEPSEIEKQKKKAKKSDSDLEKKNDEVKNEAADNAENKEETNEKKKRKKNK